MARSTRRWGAFDACATGAANGAGRLRPAIVSLSIASIAACGGEARAPVDTTDVTDSAGVAIVRNGPSTSADSRAWTLVERRVIGGASAGAAAEFGHVGDAALAGDTVYVLDVLAQLVRVFDPSGAPAREIGRPGDGPGELSGFTTSLILGPDTLSIVDWGRGAIHRFRRDGTFLHSTPIEGGTTRTWWRRARDGHTYHRAFRRVVGESGAWGGIDMLLRSRPGGADTVLTFGYSQTDVGGPGRTVLAYVVNAPSWDVLEDGSIAWTTLDDERVRLHRPDGSLERVIESEAWVRRPPSSSDAAALREHVGARMVMLGGSREVVDQLDPRPPELLPAITTVRAGPDGTMLVQRLGSMTDVHPMALNTPDPPTGWGGGTWDVLDRQGRSVGVLELGPRVRVMRVTDDRILGLRRDALDREQVVVWEVVR